MLQYILQAHGTGSGAEHLRKGGIIGGTIRGIFGDFVGGFAGGSLRRILIAFRQIGQGVAPYDLTGRFWARRSIPVAFGKLGKDAVKGIFIIANGAFGGAAEHQLRIGKGLVKVPFVFVVHAAPL